MNIDYETSKIAYEFCNLVADIEVVWKRIIEPSFCVFYCRDVKDRPEVRHHIKDSYTSYQYCRYVKDRPEMWKNITDLSGVHIVIMLKIDQKSENI